jgi:hypothetical protein
MKGKDHLDKFILSNRDAFDDKEPPVSVWENIQSTLHPQRKTGGWWNELVLWRAAAVVFFALSAYLLFPGQKEAPRVEEGTQIAMNEFDDVEAYYISEISQKVELIESIATDDVAGELTPDFQRLEAMYLVLKEEMKNRPSKKVKDALVLNLLVRIDLLNQQLHKLEGDYQEEENGNRSEI